MGRINYSVLMSVYYKENPKYFRMAIDSMFNQTVKTNDFVLVCDGDLTTELNRVIEDYIARFQDILHVIRLKENQGLGNALNIGVQCCKNVLIARMDSDDISLPNRIETQLEAFCNDPELSLCGGQIAEFIDDISHVTGVRKVPCLDYDIRKFARKRNPMNHVTVMFKKMDVIEAGNYIEISLAEDYYLWVRMLCLHKKCKNIDKTLVYVRTGKGMYERRGGMGYVKKMILVQRKLLELNFISYFDFILNSSTRCIVSLVPCRIRGWIYEKRLRKQF